MDSLKIIGLMLTWNNLEFFRCVVEQALEFCDELILVEGCHSMQYPKHSDDGTVAFIQSIKNRPKLKIMDFIRNNRYDYVQKVIRHTYPKQSHYYMLGNWVFHWDDDLFFMSEDLEKLRAMMQHSREDSLDLLERQFFYNFKFNIHKRMSPVCYRITDRLNLSGVSNAHYRSGRHYSVSRPDDITAFHYSHVKKAERMKRRFVLSAEKGTPGTIEERFGAWNDFKWDKDEDILKSGKFSIYDGEHPEVLDNHPWRYIEDVRNK